MTFDRQTSDPVTSEPVAPPRCKPSLCRNSSLDESALLVPGITPHDGQSVGVILQNAGGELLRLLIYKGIVIYSCGVANPKSNISSCCGLLTVTCAAG